MGHSLYIEERNKHGKAEQLSHRNHRRRPGRRPRKADPHPVPAGAQRLPAHRQRQGPSGSTGAFAKAYGGKFNLRYDDTNPVREDDEYVRSIEEDLRWLGAIPDGGIYYGSDYFEQCYQYAEQLITEGKAYVCDLTREQLQDTAAPSPSPAAPVPGVSAPRKKTWIFSAACARRICRRSRTCAPKSTWQAPT